MKVNVVYLDFQEPQANQACVSFVSYTKISVYIHRNVIKTDKCSLLLISGGMRGVQGEIGAMGQKGNDGQQGAPGIQVLLLFLL